ncbi:uncharacterized protein [Apostichopus japonicus]|uniref:uncharacterized protein n=1 Tax=Stichopus japonicus TaxID=307972 RepID=UPI003AB69540
MALFRKSMGLVQSPSISPMAQILVRGLTSKEPAPTTAKSTDKKPPPSSDSASSGKTYQVPEYYEYSEFSFYDIESDMAKHRIAQPVAK